jgi:hypothetical protein
MLFPEIGRDVPAEMVITAGHAKDGRACQVWRRSFAFGGRQRHFNGVLVYDAGRGTLVECLGPAGMIRVPWCMSIDTAGVLQIRTAGMWLGPLRLPRRLTAEVIATERALDPRTIHIQLVVKYPLLGSVFGYEGSFELRSEPLA